MYLHTYMHSYIHITCYLTTYEAVATMYSVRSTESTLWSKQIMYTCKMQLCMQAQYVHVIGKNIIGS